MYKIIIVILMVVVLFGAFGSLFDINSLIAITTSYIPILAPLFEFIGVVAQLVSYCVTELAILFGLLLIPAFSKLILDIIFNKE